MDHVAGYVVVNDISARDWQGIPQALREGEKGDGQWLRAKGSDTFLPMGSVLVTTDELDPAAGLRLRSWRIDGDGLEHLMQDGTTADMIWDVPGPRRVHQLGHHPGAGRRHRDRHAIGRRRLPRPARLPGAGRLGALRDRGHRVGREPDHRLVDEDAGA